MTASERCIQALNRLCKWRTIFAGWQLGTRSDTDPEARAVRDAIDVRLLLRVEVSALVLLLERKGIFTTEEWETELAAEADRLNHDYEKKFPGFRATDEGIEAFDAELVKETVKGWYP